METENRKSKTLVGGSKEVDATEEDSDGGRKASDETIGRALEIIQPLARVARDMGLVADPDVLRMPELGVEP